MYTLDYCTKNILEELNFQFLEKIKAHLPYNNAYYLVCVAEIIYNMGDDCDWFSDEQDILEEVLKKASDLYNNSDISSYLKNFV